MKEFSCKSSVGDFTSRTKLWNSHARRTHLLTVNVTLHNKFTECRVGQLHICTIALCSLSLFSKEPILFQLLSRSFQKSDWGITLLSLFWLLFLKEWQKKNHKSHHFFQTSDRAKMSKKEQMSKSICIKNRKRAIAHFQKELDDDGL